MILKDKFTGRIYANIKNEDNREFFLLTNFDNDRLDAIRLTILSLDLKNDAIITNAYNIYGDELENENGVYLDIEKYEKEPYIFDKFFNTLLYIKQQIKEYNHEIIL